MVHSSEYADISHILARKSAFVKEQKERKEVKDSVAMRISALYQTIGLMLDASPEVPGTDSENINLRYLHRVSKPVIFANGDGTVPLQLCEVKKSEVDQKNPRFLTWDRSAVQIALADESVPYEERVLFEVTESEIYDWKHESLSGENAINPPFDLQEPEAIVEVFKNALGVNG